MSDPGPLRIGEFARRVGVSPELLRAWERRYDLLRPVRSPGGFRLYTAEDADRVARMRRAIDSGLSAAEAARSAIQAGLAAPETLAAGAGERLLAAIRDYDEAAVQSVLDESLAAFGLEEVLAEIVLPTLARVGEEWREGRLTVAHEHFASHVIRGRLLALGRLWGRGGGPLAILACAPGEQHDMTLVAFGLVLRSHGWRILYLGADTPVEEVSRAAADSSPALVVVVGFDSSLLEASAKALASLAKTAPLALAGPGATEELCARLGARRLNGDLVAAAREVAAPDGA